MKDLVIVICIVLLMFAGYTKLIIAPIASTVLDLQILVTQQADRIEDLKNTKKHTLRPKGTLQFTALTTAYTCTDAGEKPGDPGYCQTAIGLHLKPEHNKKVFAVDPKVVPLGSKMYVEGIGWGIAADTGGDIKGLRVDIFWDEKDRYGAFKYGEQYRDVVVIRDDTH